MSPKIDLNGQTFGRLTVIGQAYPGKREKQGTTWLCVCSCGGSSIATGSHLRQGSTRSCGCLNREVASARARIHGLRSHPLYSTWLSMIQRCTDPKHKSYAGYGGQGITVCERWRSFANFYADMGERPDGTSLDRINGSEGYSPENCRWSTATQQNRNLRTNHMLTHNGETLCIAEWAERTGIGASTISRRLCRGWPIERALTESTPARRHPCAPTPDRHPDPPTCSAGCCVNPDNRPHNPNRRTR